MAQVIEINDGDTVNVIEVQLPFYGIASSELEFGARAAEAITVGNVVYVSGATGTHIQVSKAQANTEATSSGTIGIAKESAATNGDLQVVTFGIMSNLNTQAYTAGQVLYLSTSVAGGYQTTLPAAPNHGVKLGWVVRSHPSQGQIFVAVQNYQELEELSDVSVAGVTDGQVLTYQSSSGTWIPSTPNPGDITAVNVTSPITGGGTSGAVTVGIDQSALSLTASQISDGSTTWARLAAANTFTVGNHLITSAATNTPAITLRGATGTTVAVARIEKSTTDNTPFNEAGTLTLRNTSSTNGNSTLIEALSASGSIAAGILFRIPDQTGNTGQTYVGSRSSSGFNSNALRIDPGGGLFASNNVATTVGTIIRGAASQTGNLQEWQNSAGTILANVSSAGLFTSPRFTAQPTSGTYGLYSVSQGASAVPIVARGASGQTAALTEWQNSGGTVLAQVTAAGNIFGNLLRTNNNRVALSEENDGGNVLLRKATSTPPTPGANDFAKVYLRDGTNAGTLKLVIRAGTAGAETTILDNIPQ